MDIAKLNTCLASDDARRVINDEKSLGQSLGISSTPTYFINNKMVVGTKSLEEEMKIYFPDSK
jgi:protein-disulfide isomerase